MKIVYKYQLDPYGVLKPAMPSHAVVKHVAYQQRILNVWAEIDLEVENPNTRTLFVIGTGHDISPDLNHLATVHDPDGFHIWHIYDRMKT